MNVYDHTRSHLACEHAVEVQHGVTVAAQHTAAAIARTSLGAVVDSSSCGLFLQGHQIPGRSQTHQYHHCSRQTSIPILRFEQRMEARVFDGSRIGF